MTAAPEWDSPPHLYDVNPPLRGSLVELFDEAMGEDLLLITHRAVTNSDSQNRKIETDKDLTMVPDDPVRIRRYIEVIY